MKVICFFGTWIDTRVYKGTQSHVSENLNFHLTYSETLHTVFVMLITSIKRSKNGCFSCYVCLCPSVSEYLRQAL